MADIQAWPIWTPGALLAGFIKGATGHCYLGYVISNGDFFLGFPIVSL